MPLLKPQISATDAMEILHESRKSTKKLNSEEKSEARQILDDAGLDLESCAKKMAHIVNYAEEDTLRYKVLQDVLKIHGAMEGETQGTQNIQINFNFADQTINPIGILIPR